jgi:hypothetical protein
MSSAAIQQASFTSTMKVLSSGLKLAAVIRSVPEYSPGAAKPFKLRAIRGLVPALTSSGAASGLPAATNTASTLVACDFSWPVSLRSSRLSDGVIVRSRSTGACSVNHSVADRQSQKHASDFTRDDAMTSIGSVGALRLMRRALTSGARSAKKIVSHPV